MKKTICVLSIWMVFVAVNAFGSEYPEPTSWINDYAGVLSNTEKQDLDSILKAFENKTTAQIFVAIMDRIPSGTSLEEYVNELFAQWKPGQEEKDNGVLLAIFIQDRKLRLEVGYGFEAKLTEEACKLIITNDIVPAFKQGDYYSGIRQGLQGIILTTHEGYTFPSTAERSTTAPIPQPQPHRSFGLGSVELITIGITIVIVTTMLNFLQIVITIHGL